MSLFRLLWQSLLYHWRGNLAVLLGVAVGSAVLTGALLVGDSLQGSLRARSLRQLGWVDHVVVTPRFFRAQLADEVAASSGARIAPATFLRVTCGSGTSESPRLARGITLLGVEKSFFNDESLPPSFGEEASGSHAWLNRATARALNVKEGETITIRLQKNEAIPREAGLGKKEVIVEEWQVEVAGILADDSFAANFNLKPDLETPRNVVVSLSALQQWMKQPGQCNVLLASGETEKLNAALRERLTLDDWGLTLQTPTSRAKTLLDRLDVNRDGRLSYSEWLATRTKGKDRPRYAWVLEEQTQPKSRRIRTAEDLVGAFLRTAPYLSLESKQLLLSQEIAASGLEAAVASDLRASPTLVYLCRLQAEQRRFAGVIAALDPSLPWPLGPFLPSGVSELADDQIVLLDQGWTAATKPKSGTTIQVRFKPPESHGPAPDVVESFRLAGFVEPKGVAGDPFLTPDFPGITDREDVGAWDLPFEDDDWSKNVADEYGDAYWKEYRATPKGYVTLKKGQQLWGSRRFGEVTSIRLTLPGAEPGSITAEQLNQAASDYSRKLLARLDPALGGFTFDNVRAGALEASKGGTPFGLLFLGFSFVLIVSALLLVGLLDRLNLERRAQQVGLLFAQGYPRSTVRRLLLGEGAVLAVVGAGLGIVVALWYSRALVSLLSTLWPGGALRSFLEPYWTLPSLIYGAGGAFVISLLTIAWVVRNLSQVPPRALLAGQTIDELTPSSPPSSGQVRRWVIVIASTLVGVALLCLAPFVPGHEAQAGAFFGSGALFLTAGLTTVFAWMKQTRRHSVEGQGWGTIARLGVRNAARHPGRSLLTIGLLASSAFLLVAVESFRRRAHAGDGSIREPDGGFALVAESDLPIIRDLNFPLARREMLKNLAGDPAEAETLLRETQIVALRARAGDDASCLNLFQPRTPRVLGVPRSLIKRGGFSFSGSLQPTSAEKENPWLVLLREGENVPVFGEANTVTWMLKSGLGQSIDVPNAQGEPTALEIAGLLKDSVFQSSLLISEDRFLQTYPEQEGYHYFLIAPPEGRAEEVKQLLETALRDRGFVVTTYEDRVGAFLAVENTYLTTFQALGGLGLLLGSLGLAVVLLRGVWERRSELALLRALGWRKVMIGWLILTENVFLLLVGLLVGSVAAILSILPQLIGGTGSVPVLNLLALFGVVVIVALVAGGFAVVSTLRASIVPALRRE